MRKEERERPCLRLPFDGNWGNSEQVINKCGVWLKLDSGDGG